MTISFGTPLGRHLALGEFCTCSSTWATFRAEIDPLPRQPETVAALGDLATHLLDPLIDHYGRERFRLTYGFCSPDLRRCLERIDPATGRRRGRIAPELDQHMAFERNRRGKPYCGRPGAAADFRILDEGSDQLVDWILERALPFDSLYFYGPDRPIQLS